jgi:hypothetical protein
MARRTSKSELAVVSLALAVAACGADADGSRPSETGRETDTFAEGPAGTARVKLLLDTFELGPGDEVYKCQNFENPFGRDVAILQSQSSMSKGSHHLAVFRIDESENGELESCSGLEFSGTLHSAQTLTARTTYPEGVGAFHLGTEGVRLNAHYFNTSEDIVRPKVEVAFDFVDGDAVEYKAAQIYMNDSTLDIPPGRGTAGGTMAIPEGVGTIRVISAQSHMHRRAVGFQSWLDDGTELYDTTTWSEPPVKRFDPEVVVESGQSITWKCDYENETNQHLLFGESADTTEMCVFTGFYYPAPEGKMLVGDLGIGGVSLMR